MGHVAFVEKVENGYVTFSEGNWKNTEWNVQVRWQNDMSNPSYPLYPAQPFLGYIYLLPNSFVMNPPTDKGESFRDGTYIIRHFNSGKVMDIDNVSMENGARAHLWEHYPEHKSQLFTFNNLGNNEYRILSYNSGKMLEIENSLQRNGAKVQQWDYYDIPTGKWRFVKNNTGTYSIQNVNSNRYITLLGGYHNNGTSFVQWSKAESWNGISEQFLLEEYRLTNYAKIENGQYSILHYDSGKALDIDNVSMENGAIVHIWDYYKGQQSQIFTINEIGNCEYVIIASHSNKVLEVKDSSKSNGATVQQWDYFNIPTSKWKFVENKNETYSIQNVNSGLYLTLSNSSNNNGTIICQWSICGETAEQFTLLKI